MRVPPEPRDISAGYQGSPTLPLRDSSGLPTAEWIAAARKQAAEVGHLCIHLIRGHPGELLPGTAYEDRASPRLVEVFRKHFRPLLVAAEEARLYRVNDWPPIPNRHLDAYTKRVGRSTVVDLSANGVLDDAGFWWRMGSHRAVVTVPMAAINLRELFAESWDPMTIGNLAGLLGSAAVSYARRKSEDDVRVCICPTGNVDGTGIAIFAQRSMAANLVAQALEVARHSPSLLPYRFWYGTKIFDQEEAYTFFFRVEEEDAASAARSLEQALLDFELPGATVPALASAELIAIICGNPPLEFSADPTLWKREQVDRIRRWTARQPRPPDGLIILARDVVALVADHSHLEVERWLTAEARARWKESLVDLHARLKGSLAR